MTTTPTDGLFAAKKLDGFTHESPIRAFTDFDVCGAYAIGKGFRPSMQHLARYLDAMECKEKWKLVGILLSPTGGEPTMIFHRDLYEAVMPELQKAEELVDVVYQTYPPFSHAQGESEPSVDVWHGSFRAAPYGGGPVSDFGAPHDEPVLVKVASNFGPEHECTGIYENGAWHFVVQMDPPVRMTQPMRGFPLAWRREPRDEWTVCDIYKIAGDGIGRGLEP